MSDLLPDDAWVNTFQSTPVRPLLSALQRRLQASTTHVHALAELFHERAMIEQEYATKMSKLVRAAEAGQLSGKSAVEWDRNGGEAKIWDTVLMDIQETASAHMSLSSSLKSDFEQPVRDLPNKMVAWRQIHDQESSLDRTLKDQEKTITKLDKASAKKSAKADQLTADLNQINTTLTSLSPKVFATFQRLDEERLRSLKEVVVRWATSRADIATRDGERAEGSLTKLLSWETKDEVLAVANRLAGPHARSHTTSAQGGRSAPPAANATPASRPPMQSTGSSELTPRSNRVNGSSANQSDGSSHTTGTGGFSGFKSMLARKATVSGRQRRGSEATSMRSNRRAPDELFAPLDEGHDEGEATLRRPSTPNRQQSDRSRHGQPQVPSKGPLVDEEGFSIPPADRHKTLWDEPNEELPTKTSTGVSLPSTIFAEQRSATPETSRPSSAAGSVDTVPNSSRLNLSLAAVPIQESEEERTVALAKMQQTLQAVPGPPQRRTTIARGRREPRSTIMADNFTVLPPMPPSPVAPVANAVPVANVPSFVQDSESIEEVTDSADNDNTPLSVLAAQNRAARRLSTVSTTSSRNPFDSPSIQGQSGTSPILAAGAGAAAGAAALSIATHASREPPAHLAPESTVSSPITSTSSPISPLAQGLPASSAAVAAPPTMPQTGAVEAASSVGPNLQATMVETVHALIRQFTSQRTVITGEIHTSFVPSELRPTPAVGSALHIRITEFEALETILPNPEFLAQVPDQPGEYYLNVEALAHATAAAGPVVLFKYQVLVPEGSETAMAPLVLNPAFQVKDGETRMILHYRAAQSAPLSNVHLAVAFPDEPAVKATQSKPLTGTWSADPAGSGRIVSWDPSIRAGEESKVVARFVTSPGAPRLAPTGVQARFVLDHLISGLGLEIVDSGDSASAAVPTLSGWSFDNVRKSTVAGKYVGDATFNP